MKTIYFKLLPTPDNYHIVILTDGEKEEFDCVLGDEKFMELRKEIDQAQKERRSELEANPPFLYIYTIDKEEI
jgi:hypothetical protein